MVLNFPNFEDKIKKIRTDIKKEEIEMDRECHVLREKIKNLVNEFDEPVVKLCYELDAIEGPHIERIRKLQNELACQQLGDWVWSSFKLTAFAILCYYHMLITFQVSKKILDTNSK